jgi:hypothetical protein
MAVGRRGSPEKFMLCCCYEDDVAAAPKAARIDLLSALRPEAMPQLFFVTGALNLPAGRRNSKYD